MKLIVGILSAASLLVSTGCQTSEKKPSVSGERERIAVEQLRWLDSTDFKAELSKATATKDYRLYLSPNRSRQVVGIRADMQAQARKRCGVKNIPGLTDVRYGEVHKEYAQRALFFAKEYNTKMFRYCLASY
ncbi:hypothetical protein [Pleionea sp. CnH1-48]|uniref:hypothetical protein n=1 Tax=Pleionea sp. CnH1-48 TaxID=2954494 RepID=UPI0020986142|nr:hypothetical protein [Pleionea sp. CnH1-48]MCO7223953.1 hypothetical protein [Pleionea sp. CnH1-48]